MAAFRALPPVLLETRMVFLPAFSLRLSKRQTSPPTGEGPLLRLPVDPQSLRFVTPVMTRRLLRRDASSIREVSGVGDSFVAVPNELKVLGRKIWWVCGPNAWRQRRLAGRLKTRPGLFLKPGDSRLQTPGFLPQLFRFARLRLSQHGLNCETRHANAQRSPVTIFEVMASSRLSRAFQGVKQASR